MYPHDIRCPTNPFRPRYVGIDERTGFKVYYDDLAFQYDWRGNQVVNLNILTAGPYLDRPNELLRPVIIGPDSIPPRPRPAPGHYQQQMAGTGLTAPQSPGTQLLVLGDEALT